MSRPSRSSWSPSRSAAWPPRSDGAGSRNERACHPRAPRSGLRHGCRGEDRRPRGHTRGATGVRCAIVGGAAARMDAARRGARCRGCSPAGRVGPIRRGRPRPPSLRCSRRRSPTSSPGAGNRPATASARCTRLRSARAPSSGTPASSLFPSSRPSTGGGNPGRAPLRGWESRCEPRSRRSRCSPRSRPRSSSRSCGVTATRWCDWRVSTRLRRWRRGPDRCRGSGVRPAGSRR